MNELVKHGQQQANQYVKQYLGDSAPQIEEDGIYGAETRKQCIRCLQIAMNLDYGLSLEIDADFGILSSNGIDGHYVEKGETQEMVRVTQIALECRGYDPNGVDGIFGDGTWSAVTCFQGDNGLTVDGIVGADTFQKLFDITIQTGSSQTGSSDTGEWTKFDPSNLPNFDADEFKCECGCGGDVCDSLKQRIQLFREKIGRPVVITSGFRCAAQNAAVGGVSYSLHMQGMAADIQVPIDGVYHMADDLQREYREIAHQCGLTTGNYYGDGGGWMHLQIGRNDYDENY